jgi:hypothetical protein
MSKSQITQVSPEEGVETVRRYFELAMPEERAELIVLFKPVVDQSAGGST